MTLGIINITKREVVNKKNINIKLLIFRLDKISKGINFWTVDNKNKIQREDLLMMEINQPWNGAAPNFIIILIINMTLFELKKKNVKVSLSKQIIEAHLCNKKYFIAFSRANPGSLDIMGRNIIMFISKQIHIRKYDVVLIDIIIVTNNMK